MLSAWIAALNKQITFLIRMDFWASSISIHLFRWHCNAYERKQIPFARTVEDHRVFNQTAQHAEPSKANERGRKRRKFICDNVYFIMQDDLYMIWLPFMCKMLWCKFILAFLLFSLVFIFSKWILIFWYVLIFNFYCCCSCCCCCWCYCSFCLSRWCCTLNRFLSLEWPGMAIWFGWRVTAINATFVFVR